MSNTCHCRFIWCHLELKQTKDYANLSFPYSIIIPSVSVTDKSSLTTLGGMANCPLLHSLEAEFLFSTWLWAVLVLHLLLFNQTQTIVITEWTQYYLGSLSLAKIRLIKTFNKIQNLYQSTGNYSIYKTTEWMLFSTQWWRRTCSRVCTVTFLLGCSAATFQKAEVWTVPGGWFHGGWRWLCPCICWCRCRPLFRLSHLMHSLLLSHPCSVLPSTAPSGNRGFFNKSRGDVPGVPLDV